MNTNLNLPEAYQKDLARAVEILKAGGCREVYLFGSLVEGRLKSSSDIDLAVKGCPPRNYFPLFGELMLELDHSVDLVSLDNKGPFTDYLKSNGKLYQLG
jgi:predicted nucleotidyltransferase